MVEKQIENDPAVREDTKYVRFLVQTKLVKGIKCR